ncbi:MAG: glycoside hydrolase family 16 protein [Spirochaetes bacterium]|nr:glycoside hydrolase family 16 protein [Spirochaetota bacterium]
MVHASGNLIDLLRANIRPMHASAFFLFMIFTAVNVTAEEPREVPRIIGFETSETPAYILKGSRLSTPDQVITGNQSLLYSGEKPWSEIFATDPRTFEFKPKGTYRIRFQYRILDDFSPDGGIYILMRVPSVGKKSDAGMVKRRPVKGAQGEFAQTVTLGDLEGYVLIIGCHKAGNFLVDDITIEQVPVPTRTPTPKDRLTLVWQEEFSAPGQPDSANWNFLDGFRMKAEPQYYTTSSKNVRVSDGLLIIEAHAEKIANKNHTPGKDDWRGNGRAEGDYSSGYIDTKGKFEFMYGRVEVRAKIPSGSGVWPAIWTMGNWKANGSAAGWPACGEIDIMEYIGVEADKIHCTTHFKKDGQHVSTPNVLTTPRPFDDFHNYAIEWTSEGIYFYYDDIYVGALISSEAVEAGQNPFQKPHYLILNLALGGWGGPIDESRLPAQFLVDYARVYQFSSNR